MKHINIRTLIVKKRTYFWSWMLPSSGERVGMYQHNCQIKTAIPNHWTMCASKLLDYFHKLFPSSCKRMTLHLLNQDQQQKLFSTTAQPLNKQYTNPLTVCPLTVIDGFCRAQVSRCLPAPSTEDGKGAIPETFSFRKIPTAHKSRNSVILSILSSHQRQNPL